MPGSNSSLDDHQLLQDNIKMVERLTIVDENPDFTSDVGGSDRKNLIFDELQFEDDEEEEEDEDTSDEATQAYEEPADAEKEEAEGIENAFLPAGWKKRGFKSKEAKKTDKEEKTTKVCIHHRAVQLWNVRKDESGWRVEKVPLCSPQSVGEAAEQW